LRVTTPAGTSEAPFEITAPLNRTGRFQGFDHDDVIYLIMPDRFSDGDPMITIRPSRAVSTIALRGVIITAATFRASSIACRI
jgi:hypothetical protein